MPFPEVQPSRGASLIPFAHRWPRPLASAIRFWLEPAARAEPLLSWPGPLTVSTDAFAYVRSCCDVRVRYRAANLARNGFCEWSAILDAEVRRQSGHFLAMGIRCLDFFNACSNAAASSIMPRSRKRSISASTVSSVSACSSPSTWR